jgi:hypothetical protein
MMACHSRSLRYFLYNELFELQSSFFYQLIQPHLTMPNKTTRMSSMYDSNATNRPKIN